jgi:hypothetical protein
MRIEQCDCMKGRPHKIHHVDPLIYDMGSWSYDRPEP